MNPKTVAWKVLPIVLLLLVLIPFVPMAQAANTGLLDPSQNAIFAGGGFTNPTNAYANGGATPATKDNNANGVSHVYYGYNFPTIPAGATITDITVRLDWWLDSTFGTSSIRTYLSWDGGTNWTAFQSAGDEGTSDENPTDTLGGTWGRTWSPTEFTSNNFRVRLELITDNTGRDFRIDWVPVQVTYNLSPNTPTNSVPANGATVTNPDPTFTWSFGDPDSGDTQSGFQIQLRQNPGSYTPTAFRDNTVSSTLSSYTPSGWNLPDGNYCWHVRVTDNSGASNATSSYSPETCFTVNTAGSIGDLVWLDSDGNGIRDGGEPGIDGVTLTLRRDTTVVGTATTAGGGAYVFNNVPGPQIQTVRDEFTTAAFNNNNGSANWAADWIESDNSGAGAGAGDIQITGGQLRLADDPNSLARQVNLSGFNFATLTFDVATNGADSDDTVILEVSSNGGGAYTTIATFSDDQSGPRSYDLTPYISANTRIRFTVDNNYDSTGEFFAVDNVQIRSENTTFSTYTVTVDPGNFNPGGPLAGLNGTSSVASPHTVVLNTGQNVTSVDFGYGNFAVIGDLLYEDTNRNGVFDSGEPGLPAGIEVLLYTDGNGNGQIDGADSLLRTAFTDANGLYALRGVPSGNYTVRVDESDPALPGAFQATSANPVAVANVVIGNTYNTADIGFNSPPAVTKPLYLKPSDILNRNLPTGANSVEVINQGGTNTWTQSPALADKLVLTGATIPVKLYMDGQTCQFLGFPQGQPTINVQLSYEGGVIASVNNFSVPAGVQLSTLNLTPAGQVTLNAGQHLALTVAANCAQGIGSVQVYYDGTSHPSAIELPTFSYLKTSGAGAYDAAYPGGANTSVFIQGQTAYLRITASDPFGAYDITSATLSVPGLVTNTAMSVVSTNALSKIYETPIPNLVNGAYTYTITVTEGSENQVFSTANGAFSVIVSNLGSSTKTVNKATAAPGEVLTYTITLSNTGALPATVSMTDTLPANVTYLSGPTGPAGASFVAPNVLFNGTVPANGQILLTYLVTANSPLDDGTQIINSATISDAFNRFDTSPAALTIIDSAPNLSQSRKTVNLTTAAPGDNLDYTIVLTNSGNMNAVINSANPVLDEVPANTTFNGNLFASAGTINYNPGFNRIEWFGAVPAGGSITLRYRARLATPLDNGTIITNTAQINEGAGFDSPQTYQRVATTTINSAPNLTSQSSKLVDRATAAPNDGLAYTIILRNIGNMNAPGVVLSDTLPADVTWGGDAFMSATSGSIQFITATRTVSWTGDVNAGTTVQILFRATVNSPLPNGTQIINVANVRDEVGNFTPFNLQATTSIQATPNLNSSTKTVNTPTAVPGQTLTYTIRLANTGNAVANASFVDTLAAQLQNPVIVSVTGGQAQITGSNQITWTGQITPGQPVTVTFRADLLPVLNNGIQVNNTAVVNDGFNPSFSINPPAVTTIQSSPNLNTSRKVVDKATASPGDTLVYTIILTNTGNMAANTLVQDVLPDNITFSGGLSASPGAPLPTYSAINNRITWQGLVTPGTIITASYRVQLNTPLANGLLIENDATINDGVNAPFDTDPPAQTTVIATADLSGSSKIVDLATASPGDPLHYTIHLVNTGNTIATGVSISDTIPSNVTFSSGPFVTGNGTFGWNPVLRRVTWNGQVAPGSDVFLEYFVTVNTPLTNGLQITNTAQIAGGFGTLTTNAVTTTVQSDHDFTLTKNAPSVIGATQNLTYTIQYNVTGNEPAPGVVITDRVPVNTSYVSCSGGASCIQAGGVVTWTLNNLVPGNSGTVNLVVTVGSVPNNTVIDNTARIFDGDGASAQNSASTTVTSGHGFSLVKRDTGFDPVQAGGSLTYSIDWSVAGSAPLAQAVIITDAVPANTIYVSCGPAPCSQAGGIVTWTLGDRNTGASGTVTMTVTVASPLPNGTILNNQARISDSNGGVPTTDSEQTTVNSSHTLDIEKSGPPAVSAGGRITYTLNWAVTGNETSQNLVIQDNTPPNTVFAGASGAGATIISPTVGTSGQVTWQLGNRNPGQSGSVTLVVTTTNPLPNGTIIDNTATIQDNNGGTGDQDTTSTTVGSSHGFILTKTDTPDPVAPGGSINYNIHWEVTGNESAVGLTITDTIPANTTFQGCGSCNFQGNLVTWDLGNRAAGSSGDVSLQVSVNSPLPNGTVITNTARIFDSNNGTRTNSTATTPVQSGHQLTLSKGAPSVVQAGQALAYTLNWAVTGNESAPGVVITDRVPANTTFVSCGGVTCTQAGGVVTWTLNTRAPGSSGTVGLTVTVGAAVPNTTIINNLARIFDTSGASALANASTTVSNGHGFTLVKTDNIDPAPAGGQLVYTIAWSVVGSENPTNVVITDAVPLNTSYVSCGGASCSQAGGVVTWNIGNPGGGASGTVNMTVNVASPLPDGTLLNNQARISDSNGGVPTTATQQTTVSSSHALDVRKVGPASVPAGGLITYTIFYTVTGSETAQGLVIEDNTPVNTTFVSASGAASINNPGVGNNGLVRWNIGNRAPGPGGVVTLTVQVASPLPNGTTINNSASIRDNNGGASDQDETTTTVNSSHSLTLTKTDTPDPVSPNGIITYIIHWTVSGNELAQNVVITDLVPVGTTYRSCSGANSCFAQNNQTLVRWNLGTLAPGSEGDVILQVQVAPLTPKGTVITNSATIFDNNNGGQVTATTTTTVQSSHILTLDKSAPATVGPGRQIIYTLNYAVVGDEIAPGVVISDTIPLAGLTFVNCTGNCSVVGSLITWDLGDLPPGTTGQIQLVLRVGNFTPNGTQIVNTATIGDNSGASDTASATTQVGAELSIDLSDGRTTVQPGERMTYTLTFSSSEPLSFGSVGMDLPANTSLVSASAGYIQSGDTIFWLLAAQGAGFTGQRIVVVQLPPALDNGTIISATATIAGDSQSNQDTESATVVSSPNLAASTKTVNNPGALGGELVTYQITLSNTGTMHAYNTVVTDVMPAGLVYVGNLIASGGAPAYTNGEVHWSGQVQVNIPVVISFTTQVTDTAEAGIDINNIVQINDGVNPTLERNATIKVGSGAATSGQTFLPFLTHGTTTPPPTGPDIELVIRNCGDTNAVGAFWVDLYLNPNEGSTFWPIGHGEGYDWFGQGAGFTVSSLAPGQSLTLRLADAVVKNIPNPLPASPRLYAQVDLFDKSVPGLGVVDEGTNGEKNNVGGSNGSVCSATPGQADLIVESITRVAGSNGAASLSSKSAPVEGVEPAPARAKPQ